MKNRLRLLHLEDNPHDTALIGAALEEDGFDCDVVHVNTRHDFERAIALGGFDLVLSDFALPGYDGLSALALVKKVHPNLPFILVSGTIGEDAAVDTLKSGATDYVLKTRLVRLVPAVRRALNESETQSRQRDTEEKLRESQELFRKIMENVDDLIAVVDLEEKRVFNSPSYRSMYQDIGSLAGTDAFAEIHPEDRQRIRRIFHETVSTGQGRRSEYRLLPSNGAIRDIESQSSVIRDSSGKITNVLFVARDITSRKQQEAQIREQAALLDKAQDAICVKDLSQQIHYWNKGAQRLYGWTAEEAIGRNADDLLFHGESEQSLHALREIIRRGEWQGEMYKVNRKGHELIVESRWTLMRDSKGIPKSILVIDTDITERKQAESRFLRTQRMEGIGAVAGGIAHDLNNTLAPILMAADILRDELGTDSGRKMLATIESSAMRGSEMVKQILSFARGIGGRHTALHIKHLMTDMEKFVKGTFPPSIKVEKKVPSNLHLILGDATQLHQVLLNLCVNARDAMPEGGRLTMEAANIEVGDDFSKKQSSGPHVVMTVTDTGCGMPAEMIDKIFEPFFTTKEAGKGTGLGLSTVMSIVKTHSGFLEVNSEAGQGTAFRVYIPAVEKDVQNTEAEPADLPRGSGELIMLVDDDHAILEMAKLNLEAHGYHVTTANDGAEALVNYQQHQEEIKAIVTDMLMPVMNGLELIKKLRAINPGVKIIGISGLGSGGELSKAAKPMVQAFLTKPYNTASLLRLLRDAVAKNGV